jgi:hypothetical protein
MPVILTFLPCEGFDRRLCADRVGAPQERVHLPIGKHEQGRMPFVRAARAILEARRNLTTKADKCAGVRHIG